MVVNPNVALGGYRFNVYFDRKEMSGGGGQAEYPSIMKMSGGAPHKESVLVGIDADRIDQVDVEKRLRRSTDSIILFGTSPLKISQSFDHFRFSKMIRK